MDNAYKEFENYVSNYDHDIDGVNNKHHHTFRVVDITKRILGTLDVSKSDEELALKCSLLHDIARFKQITEYGTFIDSLSFDHGNMGEKILLENNYISKYEEDKTKQNIILAAVRNHNKFKIEDGLDEKTTFFCKIVRDADKIDIIRKQGLFSLENDSKMNEKICESLLNNKMVENDDVKSKADNALRQLGFVFDLNFTESYRIIKEEKIVEGIIDNLKKYNDSDYIDQIKKVIIDYINLKIDK